MHPILVPCLILLLFGLGVVIYDWVTTKKARGSTKAALRAPSSRRRRKARLFLVVGGRNVMIVAGKALRLRRGGKDEH